MKSKLLTLLFLFFISSFSLGQETDVPSVSSPLDRNDNVPEGWFKGGTQPQDYAVGVEHGEGVEGNSCAYITSKEIKPVGSCNLVQEIKAENYRGERVRLSGYIKSKFISYWAGLFLIVEDAIGRPVSYDNMQNRPVVGSSEWIKYEIVLDIPQNSERILFGAALNGKGTVWIDDLKLLVVSKNVPVTDLSSRDPSSLYPVNMNFEK